MLIRKRGDICFLTYDAYRVNKSLEYPAMVRIEGFENICSVAPVNMMNRVGTEMAYTVSVIDSRYHNRKSGNWAWEHELVSYLPCLMENDYD